MSFLTNIFTWWNGATMGTRLWSARNGEQVGQDNLGNIYLQSRKEEQGRRRRWVIYNGPNDASRVPPEWHGWLHGTLDAVPEDILPPARAWEQEPSANLTGTTEAYRPSGALEVGGTRAAATGDYEAWSPK